MAQKSVKTKKLEKYELEAPVYADQTCPHIDLLLEMLDGEIKNVVADKNMKFYEEVQTLFNAQLEYIRSANSTLRDSGKYWKGIAKKEIMGP